MVEIEPHDERRLKYRTFSKREERWVMVRDIASIIGFTVLIIVTGSLILSVAAIFCYIIYRLFGGQPVK